VKSELINMQQAIIVGLLIVVGLFICPVVSYADMYMSISGTVKDADTEKGIAGIEVVLSGQLNGKRYSSKTDNNGVYVIGGIIAGDYSLAAYPADKYYSTSSNKTIKVEKGKNIIAADFKFAAGGSVSGTIRKSDGTTPLANSTLAAITPNGVVLSKTDVNGKFILSGISSTSSTTIKIMINGYANLTVKNIAIIAGETSSIGDIQMLNEKQGINGTVTETESGAPMADAFVIIRSVNEVVAMATTDGNGNYSVRGMDIGTYSEVVCEGDSCLTIPAVTVTKDNTTCVPVTKPPTTKKWKACGSGWSEYVVPDIVPGGNFNEACNNHDNCYDYCHKNGNGSKELCDKNFLTDMNAACYLSVDALNKPACYIVALIYYEFVKLRGDDAYTKAQTKTCCGNAK
jgi:hypothetical protein